MKVKFVLNGKLLVALLLMGIAILSAFPVAKSEQTSKSNVHDPDIAKVLAHDLRKGWKIVRVGGITKYSTSVLQAMEQVSQDPDLLRTYLEKSTGIKIPHGWKIVFIPGKTCVSTAAKEAAKRISPDGITISIDPCSLSCGSKGKGVIDTGTYTTSYAYVEGKYNYLLFCLGFGCSYHDGWIAYNPNSFCWWSFNTYLDPLGRYAWTEVAGYAGPSCGLDSDAYAYVHA